MGHSVPYLLNMNARSCSGYLQQKHVSWLVMRYSIVQRLLWWQEWNTGWNQQTMVCLYVLPVFNRDQACGQDEVCKDQWASGEPTGTFLWNVYIWKLSKLLYRNALKYGVFALWVIKWRCDWLVICGLSHLNSKDVQLSQIKCFIDVFKR